MRWERIAIEQLRPAPYNPRVALRPGDAAYERLARSIDEFDLVQPLVWNRRSGHVVGGHQRLEILRQRGETAVDCVVVDLAPEREKALNIALNNSAVGGDWEPQKLLDLVEELQELPDFDATLTGFDEQQLRDMLFSPAGEWPAAGDDPVETGEEAGLVRVTLEVPGARWERVRESLDELIAAEPDVRLHVS